MVVVWCVAALALLVDIDFLAVNRVAGSAPQSAILAALAQGELLHVGDNAQILPRTVVDEDLPGHPGFASEVTALASFIALGLSNVSPHRFGEM